MSTRLLSSRQLLWLQSGATGTIIALFCLWLYQEPAQPWDRWHWLGLCGAALALMLLVSIWRMARQVRHQLGAEPGQLHGMVSQIVPGLTQAGGLPGKAPGNLVRILHELRDGLQGCFRQSERNLGQMGETCRELARNHQNLANHGKRYRHSVQQARELSGQLGQSLSQHNMQIELTRQGVERALRLAQASGHALLRTSQNLEATQDTAQTMRAVVDTMDGLVVQSTLLALDASVEAAKAEQAGPALIQIAAQMRDLAQVSAQSSHQIRDLLQSSARQTALAGQATHSALADMGELLGSLQQDVERVNRLSCAGRAQSALARQFDPVLSELELQNRRHGVLLERATHAAGALQAQHGQQVRLMAGLRVGVVSDSVVAPVRNPAPRPATLAPLAPLAPGTVSASAQIISFKQAARARPRRQVLEDWEQF
jgi:hypothetical protein